MLHPTAPTLHHDAAGPTIWSNGDRVVACATDGSVVGTFATVAEAERALAGNSRRWLATITRRPRYARSAA